MDHCTRIAFIFIFQHSFSWFWDTLLCSSGLVQPALWRGRPCATFYCRSWFPRVHSLHFLRIEAELNLFFVTLNFNQDGPKTRQVVTPALFFIETSLLRLRLKSACSLPYCNFQSLDWDLDNLQNIKGSINIQQFREAEVSCKMLQLRISEREM